VLYKFDWDLTKEQANIRKHAVSFRTAATVFRDPNQVSIYDVAHSEHEDRWVTMGFDKSGVLRVVVHTFQLVAEEVVEIRIISARKATREETRQYHEGNI
jgi:hypothetical protein